MRKIYGGNERKTEREIWREREKEIEKANRGVHIAEGEIGRASCRERV